MSRKEIRQQKLQKKIDFKSWRVTSLLVVGNLVVVALLLLFMTHSDNQASTIATYTRDLSSLSIQNQLIQSQIAQAQSIDTVEQKSHDLGMVPASSIVYVNNSNAIAENLSGLSK